MKNIKVSLLIISLVFVTTLSLYADPYPAPTNVGASIGVVDTIRISWDVPIPPEYGEGFESGVIPPTDWELESKNIGNTWQIMDNIDYVNSGSYSACVPWTDSPGTFLDYGEEKIVNGLFNAWTDHLPDDWDIHGAIMIDSTSSVEKYLKMWSSSSYAYVSQACHVDKYSHYMLSFKAKQDLSDNGYEYEYTIKVYSSDSELLLEKKLNNPDWQLFEFDVYTGSYQNIIVRLYSNKSSDSTYVYWDDISLKQINYDPNQDEWLISPGYNVSPSDEVSFYLGTSKLYGKNAPVFVLLSIDDGNSWNDTLTVCDGFDHNYNYWGTEDGELEEFTIPFSSFIVSEQTIRIAFRYIGGNGDMVCLDDVIIGQSKADFNDWFVIQNDNYKVKHVSRNPFRGKQKANVLTGFSIYRKKYSTSLDFKKVGEVDIGASIYNDTTNVQQDYAYIYKVKSIYNNIIESAYSKSATGCIFDASIPGNPREMKMKRDIETNKLTYTMHWANPIIYNDLERYKLAIEDTLLYYNFQKEPNTYDKLVLSNDPENNELQLYNKILNYSFSSADFNGNENITYFQLLPPPKFAVTTENLNYQIKVIISKWGTDQECSPSDSVKLYRSLTNDDDFVLYKTITDTNNFVDGVCEFIDSDVNSLNTYWYYSTIDYQDSTGAYLQSTKSFMPSNGTEPKSLIDNVNISNTTCSINDNSITFNWDEPEVDSLSYGGVYIYIGNAATAFDTVSIGNTTYTYTASSPRIIDMTLCPFDKFGKARKKTTLVDDINIFYDLEIGLSFLPICLDPTKKIENFEDGIDPLWTQINNGGQEAEWYVTDDGSSQWFEVPDNPDGTKYAIINDDLVGQFVITDCYLFLPPFENFDQSSKIYLSFDGYLPEDYDGSAFIALKNRDGEMIDVIDVFHSSQYYSNDWKRYNYNLSPKLQENSSFDYFEIGFHYDDNGNWTQGWTIDNVALLSNYVPESSVITKFSNDQDFYYYKKFPNPFFDTVNFSFILKEESKISLDIYNIKGQQVKCIDEICKTGINNIQWDGLDSKGKNLPNGVYLYTIIIDNDTKAGKIIKID